MSWIAGASRSLLRRLEASGATDLPQYLSLRASLPAELCAEVDLLLFQRKLRRRAQDDPAYLLSDLPDYVLAYEVSQTGLQFREVSALESIQVLRLSDLRRTHVRTLFRAKNIGRGTIQRICACVSSFVLRRLEHTARELGVDAESRDEVSAGVAFEPISIEEPPTLWEDISSAWIHELQVTDEALAEELSKVGAINDARYMASRNALTPASRARGDYLRFKWTLDRRPKVEPCRLVQMSPPEICSLSIGALNFSVRAFNALRGEGLETIGSLADRPNRSLLAIPNLGLTTVENISHVLRTEISGRLRRKLGAHRATANNVSTASHASVVGSTYSLPLTPPSALKPLTLREVVDQFLESLTDRQRSIFLSRISSPPLRLTLEQTGELFGVTRERVRQIEKKLKTRALKEPWVMEIGERITALVSNREGPLFTYMIGVEDEWFSGFSRSISLLSGLIELATDGRVHVLQLNGLQVFSKLSEEELALVVKAARTGIKNISPSGPTKLQCRLIAQSICIGAGAPELAGYVWSEIESTSIFVASDDESVERLASTNRTIEQGIQGLLRLSSRPLHYSEAAEILRRSGLQDEADIRTVHNAMQRTYQFGRGIYGMWHHLRATDEQIESVVGAGRRTYCEWAPRPTMARQRDTRGARVQGCSAP